VINVEKEIKKIGKLPIYEREEELEFLSRRLATERDKAVEIASRLAIDCGVEAPTKKWVIQQIEKKG
jgi:hypothetical protein